MFHCLIKPSTPVQGDWVERGLKAHCMSWALETPILDLQDPMESVPVEQLSPQIESSTCHFCFLLRVDEPGLVRTKICSLFWVIPNACLCRAVWWVSSSGSLSLLQQSSTQ